MAPLKSELLSLRMTPNAKVLLTQCAEREHRSLASMVEHMIHVYAESQGIRLGNDRPPHKNTPSKPHD
ncbi:MAG: hypothetical protein EON58_03160 [Alphaproteobacteria bacterium]|nr:MAG: hypothetical protein EON58_03160 [Alphaproteobacteria bacterium]